MNAGFLLFFLFNSSWAFGLCLPAAQENKMSVDHVLAQSEDLAQSFEGQVLPHLPRQVTLTVQLQPLDPRVNAEITKADNHATIQVLGGMLNHPKMNPSAFQLLLCHELGHLLGGPPTKARGGWSSTEGQSDYYSGSSCARILGLDEIDFIEGAQALGEIYAEVMREPSPRIDQCDDRRAERINFGYPSVQCRLDTMLAGWRGSERPACWFPR